MKVIIESLQNDKIKHLSRLMTDNRFRKKSQLFVVEGRQENERALKFGFQAEEFFICENIFSGELPTAKIHFVSEQVYGKLAYRGTSEGVLGIYKTKINHLDDFQPRGNSSVIVVESVEKPGNLGAILRSCEAFGIDALIITDSRADFYNPNVIRSSVGCLFGMEIYQSDNERVYQFLKDKGFNIYTTFMSETAVNISEKDFRRKSAIVFGTEHSGISDYWLGKSENILIPMVGTIDSLNLSNAVAISCYEILRQKI
ncbi:MAG: TrmH family RNA methyltransferase [Bergeyella zoohelcum]|nr:TrmH family RNA methyltransferase [Bergeyella zoohelcum]